MRKVIGYIRVSRDRAGDDKISPAIQREAIEKYCLANDLVLTEVIQDLDVKGSSFDRPGWKELINKLPAVAGVVFYSLDRFGRNLEESLKWGRYLREHGKELFSVNEQIDVETLGGKIHYKMMLFLSDLFLDMHAQRMKDVHKHKRTVGEWSGGGLPFGYRSVAGEQPTIFTPEAEAVKQIFSLRMQGKTYNEIIEEVSKTVYIKKSRLAYILRNRTYTGYRLDNNGEKFDCGFPPLIDEDEFEKVQRTLPLGSKKDEHYLKGRMYCSKCGAIMYRHRKTTRKNPAYLWECSASLNKGGCSGVSIVEERIRKTLRGNFNRLTPGIWDSWTDIEKAKALDILVEGITILPMQGTANRVRIAWRTKKILPLPLDK